MKHNAVHGRMFSAEECQRLVAAVSRLPREVGTITERGEFNSDIRACQVTTIKRADSDLGWLFERADAWISQANEIAFGVDIDPRGPGFLQYTVYTVGCHYRTHMDTHLTDGAETMRKVSFSTLLNPSEEFEGGDFYLHGELVPALSEPGMAVGFPSISQHEVAKVTRGRRVALVGWYEGPPWR